jgi:hypothetical protein
MRPTGCGRKGSRVQLENAGLITTERRGKYLSARIRQETIEDMKGLLADLSKNRGDAS